MNHPRASDAASALPRFLTSLRRVSLTVKLAALGAVVTALVVFASFWALSVQTRRISRQLFADQLSRHQASLLRAQRETLDGLISGAALVSQSPALRSALATYRLESSFGGAPRTDLVLTVERVLQGLHQRLDRDLVILTDEAGDVFAASSRTPEVISLARATTLSTVPAVRGVLTPSAASDSGALAVVRLGRTAYQLAVYPVVLEGTTIGALLFGDPLDDGLIASARAAFEGEVVVTAGDSILAGDGRDPALAPALALALRGGDEAATIRVNDEELVVAPLPLGETKTGERVTLWLMQPLGGTVRTLTAPLLRDLLMYGLIAVALSALGAALAARSVLKPFREFVAYLRSDAAGARGRRFETRQHSAEIHSLNESFQVLMDSIETKQQELAKRTTELTVANAVLLDEMRERQRVEHTLGERDQQLRQSQKLEAVGTLAGGIAHDFNNLLTAVSGFTQLALLNSDPESDVARDLRQVVQAADRAGHLTKQLLAFSRKQVMRTSVLDVTDVIDGVAPLFERLLGEHIKLRMELADSLPRVMADRGQLEQVIMNLAINARDAMPRGGSLTISATADPTLSDGKGVVITVVDTGEGIPESIRGRIFEPFFTTKEPGKGTGLGLSTVYGIITQSGGRIEVESAVGKGTAFRIRLPAVNEKDLGTAAEDTPRPMPRGTETILLVEDDAAVRGLARRTLEGCGYTVIPSGDPLEALDVGKSAKIDMILSDILMPHMTGPEMVEQFIAEHPAPVVVFMSGYADDALMSDSRSLRAAFLRKPFTPALLATTVRQALDASLRTPLAAI